MLIYLCLGMLVGDWPTLGELLKKESVEVASLPEDASDLGQTISSFKVYQDKRYFLLAYYHDLGTDKLDSRLRILQLDRVGKAWRYKEFGKKTLGRLGSVSEIHKTEDFWLIQMHMNPSSANTPYFDLGFNYSGVMNGMIKSTIKPNCVLLRDNQPHFGLFRSLFMYIYDLEDRSGIYLYPTFKPGEHTQAHLDGIKRSFENKGMEWPPENDPFGSQRFDGFLIDHVVDSDGLALLVGMEHRDLWTYGQRFVTHQLRQAYEAGKRGDRERFFQILHERIRNGQDSEMMEAFFEEAPLELEMMLRNVYSLDEPDDGRYEAMFEREDKGWSDERKTQLLLDYLRPQKKYHEVLVIFEHVPTPERGPAKFEEYDWEIYKLDRDIDSISEVFKK